MSFFNKFFASVICAVIFLSIVSALPVGAQTSRNSSTNKQSTSAEGNLKITPTQSSTAIIPTETPRPSNQSRPTATPIPVPPPSDPRTIQLMALFGILIMAIVIYGIWINRRKLF